MKKKGPDTTAKIQGDQQIRVQGKRQLRGEGSARKKKVNLCRRFFLFENSMQIKFALSQMGRESLREEGRKRAGGGGGEEEDGSGQFHPGKYIQDWPHSHKELVVVPPYISIAHTHTSHEFSASAPPSFYLSFFFLFFFFFIIALVSLFLPFHFFFLLRFALELCLVF
jgi:hypothetical protein